MSRVRTEPAFSRRAQVPTIPFFGHAQILPKGASTSAQYSSMLDCIWIDTRQPFFNL